MSAPGSPKPGAPTLHHLSDSQSQRILWLLEELALEYKLEYNIVLYARHPKTKRAPAELAAVHPLGRSPTLVTADGRTLIESLTITRYLLKTYDTRNKFAAEDWIREDTLASFSSATLFPLVTQEMLFDLAAKSVPWPFNYIIKRIKKAHDKLFSDAEFKKDMELLQSELGEGEWFNGKELGMADFVMSWPMDVIAVRGYVDLEKTYPTLYAWRTRLQQRPAWKSALEKGNQYDLDKLLG
ncbi:uncharacterized protein L3040_002689 [Drepanopeziza brunnea f. sp. 'multigermtubi']|uniref:Glutathione S-transferase n=1 Tax=Marssonina brunnea f. sp. multigermtubi (strain MB_m1) TaxID=1072389 RepID=K1WXT2_MARBU|nr:glutathione S-transferase [Drepanopeziza brunnea f. sp. 'multigermtubi' MB_m1]EKD13453.1 glutathione S-transferase [Drepanopeziza brunnea f. sp. 'multigermtubi' MB_m1]KAJ5050820.1 hypothetical protein L3040_002689 [Drepanopeziza brunnea f. sp. 'multigermtubi']